MVLTKSAMYRADLDLRATFECGNQDLQVINDRMWRVATKIVPHCKTLAEVAAFFTIRIKFIIVRVIILVQLLLE